MQNNDLSNKGAQAIAIRVEDTLLKMPKRGIVDKLLPDTLYFNKVTFDKRVLRLLYTLYRRTDFNVYLLVSKNLEKGVKNFLAEKDIAFTSFLVVDSEIDIALYLNSEFIKYYVDSDFIRRNRVPSSGCLSPSELETIINNPFKGGI